MFVRPVADESIEQHCKHPSDRPGKGSMGAPSGDVWSADAACRTAGAGPGMPGLLAAGHHEGGETRIIG